MREIKFRAWDNKRKEWIAKGFNIIGEYTVFGMLEQYQAERIKKNDSPEGLIMSLNDIIINQYTGFKDASDKEIYEGDIVNAHAEYGGNYMESPEYESYRYIVEWDAEYGRFVFTDAWSGDTIGADEAGEFDKVVGNILENPDPTTLP